jgi:hypothetical protein
MDAPLGNNYIVKPGVDEPDRAIVIRLPDRFFGIASKAQDLLDARSSGRNHLDGVNLWRERTIGPAFGIEINAVPCLNQISAKVGDISLCAPF